MNHKQIAKQIQQDYYDGRFTRLPNGRLEFTPAPNFKVRCLDGISQVRDLVERFETKPLPYGGLTPSAHECNRASGRGKSTRAVCSVEAFLAFWLDGEEDNAREYLRMFPREKWPTKALQILRRAEV